MKFRLFFFYIGNWRLDTGKDISQFSFNYAGETADGKLVLQLEDQFQLINICYLEDHRHWVQGLQFILDPFTTRGVFYKMWGQTQKPRVTREQ